jgi:uncharacterized protein (DUF3084 family)
LRSLRGLTLNVTNVRLREHRQRLTDQENQPQVEPHHTIAVRLDMDSLTHSSAPTTPMPRSTAPFLRPLVLEPMRAHSGILPVLLDGRRVVVGTAEDCSLRLAIPGVEPRHCLILAGPHGPIVKAWDQRTWLNDRPVREAGLRDGDRLAIGPFVMRVRKARDDESSPARNPKDATVEVPQSFEKPTVERLVEPVSEKTADAAAETAVEKLIADAVPDGSLSSRAEPDREARRRQLQKLRERRAALARSESESNDLLAQLVARRQELEERTIALEGLETRLNAALAPRQREVADREAALAAIQSELDARELALSSRLADLATREQAVEERGRRLDNTEQLAARTSASLARKRGLVSDLAGELLTHQGSIEAQKRAIEHDRKAAQQQLSDAGARLAEAARQEADVRKQLGELTTRESILATRTEGVERQLRELSEGMERVTELKKSLAARSSELDDRQQELAGRETALEDKAATLLRKEESLASEQRRLDEVRRDVEGRVAQVAEREREQETRERALAQRSEELQTREDGLALKSDEVAQREADVERRTTENADRETALSSRENELSNLVADIDRRTTELSSREATIADREEHLTSREASLSESEALIAAQTELAQSRKAELDARSAELMDQESRLQAGRDELARGQAQLTTGGEELQVARRDLQEVREEMDREIERLSADERRLGERNEELVQRERELDDRLEIAAGRESQLDRRERSLSKAPSEEPAIAPDPAIAARAAELDERESHLKQLEEQLSAERSDMEARVQELELVQQELDSRRRNLASIAALVSPAEPATEAMAVAGEPVNSGDDSARREELESLSTEMAQRITEIETRESALIEQETVLEAARKAAADLQSRLHAEAQQLEADRAEVEAERLAVDADRRILDEQAEALNQQELRLSSRDNELTAREQRTRTATEPMASLATVPPEIDPVEEMALPTPVAAEEANPPVIDDVVSSSDSVTTPEGDQPGEVQLVPPSTLLEPELDEASSLDRWSVGAFDAHNPLDASLDELAETGLIGDQLDRQTSHLSTDPLGIASDGTEIGTEFSAESDAPPAPAAEMPPPNPVSMWSEMKELSAWAGGNDPVADQLVPNILDLPTPEASLDGGISTPATRAVVEEPRDDAELPPISPVLSVLDEPNAVYLANADGASGTMFEQAPEGGEVDQGGNGDAPYPDLEVGSGLMGSMDSFSGVPLGQTGQAASPESVAPQAEAPSARSTDVGEGEIDSEQPSADMDGIDDEERQLQDLESRLRREREQLAALEERWRNPAAFMPPTPAPTAPVYGVNPFGPGVMFPGVAPFAGGPQPAPSTAPEGPASGNPPMAPGNDAQASVNPAIGNAPSGGAPLTGGVPITGGAPVMVSNWPGQGGFGTGTMPVAGTGDWPASAPVQGTMPAQGGAATAAPGMFMQGFGQQPITMVPMMVPPMGAGQAVYLQQVPSSDLPPSMKEEVVRPKSEPYFPTESGPLINSNSALGLPSELESLPNLDLSDDTAMLLGEASRMDEVDRYDQFGLETEGGVAVASPGEMGALLSEDDLAELQDSHHANEAPPKAEGDGSVRSLLAEMFGIDDLGNGAETPVETAESSETPADDSATAVAEPEPEAELSDDDTIAEYMERLLARSRKGGPEAPVTSVPAMAPSVETSRRTVAPKETSVEELDLSLVNGEQTVTPVHPVGPMVPRAKVDPSEQRIRNEYLREVANKSARLALARHKQRQQRSARLFKGAVAAASLALGGAILGGVVSGSRLQSLYGIVALGISVFMGGSLGLDFWSIRKLRRSAMKAGSSTPTAVPAPGNSNLVEPLDGESAPAETADLVGSDTMMLIQQAVETAEAPSTDMA